MRLEGFEHVEFYVGNARQAAYFYCRAFGFRPCAGTGGAAAAADRMTVAVEQGAIKLLLTSALDPSSPVAEHVRLHGDGIRDIAFRVEDAARAFEEVVRRGARPVLEPTAVEHGHGRSVKATVEGFGDTVHSFIQRDGGPRPNGGGGCPPTPDARPTGLAAIDHAAIVAERGTLDELVEFYTRTLGLHLSHQEDVVTPRSAMSSKVVANEASSIKLPIVAPAPGNHRSQIEEYLDSYRGPGTQHIALLSDDIVRTVRTLRGNGVQFLTAPAAYYDGLRGHAEQSGVELAALRELNILYDHCEEGYLLQIFTEPMQSRPTFFFEIIQREGSRGFGGGNIRALFEAVEREQVRRGFGAPPGGWRPEDN
jgi:4-hydroxyphenylpyruvate dioxygenase